uniref:Uncharacterized protein n=1 Tax=Coccidioides posadasii RMSCC 3488 TaxID=454284 RepID=A0A0J6I0Z0_COCPO|nr:hypothetical protein CPAG_01294 [Coccidioides posadasii RMSCC 3488]
MEICQEWDLGPAQDKSHGSNIRTDQSKGIYTDVASTSLRFYLEVK